MNTRPLSIPGAGGGGGGTRLACAPPPLYDPLRRTLGYMARFATLPPTKWGMGGGDTIISVCYWYMCKKSGILSSLSLD